VGPLAQRGEGARVRGRDQLLDLPIERVLRAQAHSRRAVVGDERVAHAPSCVASCAILATLPEWEPSDDD